MKKCCKDHLKTKYPVKGESLGMHGLMDYYTSESRTCVICYTTLWRFKPHHTNEWGKWIDYYCPPPKPLTKLLCETTLGKKVRDWLIRKLQ